MDDMTWQYGFCHGFVSCLLLATIWSIQLLCFHHGFCALYGFFQKSFRRPNVEEPAQNIPQCCEIPSTAYNHGTFHIHGQSWIKNKQTLPSLADSRNLQWWKPFWHYRPFWTQPETQFQVVCCKVMSYSLSRQLDGDNWVVSLCQATSTRINHSTDRQ